MGYIICGTTWEKLEPLNPSSSRMLVRKLIMEPNQMLWTTNRTAKTQPCPRGSHIQKVKQKVYCMWWTKEGSMGLTLGGGAGQCLSNFSVAVIEFHDQGNWRKNEFVLAYDLEGLRVTLMLEQRQGGRGRKLRSHFELQARSRESKCLKWHEALKFHSPLPVA